MGQDVQSDADAEDALFQVPLFLASVLQSLPSALTKCGLDEDDQGLLLASMMAVNHVHTKFTFPESAEAPDNGNLVHDLEKAANAWKKLDWFRLGEILGHMPLELTLQSFPELYDVDSTGKLRERPHGNSILPIVHFAAVPALVITVAAVFRGVAAAKRRQSSASTDEVLLE